MIGAPYMFIKLNRRQKNQEFHSDGGKSFAKGTASGFLKFSIASAPIAFSPYFSLDSPFFRPFGKID